MSVESPEALERSVLGSKDREQLLAIAAAIGVKATSRAKKAEIIDKILTQIGHDQSTVAPPAPPRPRANGRAKAATVVDAAADAPVVVGDASSLDGELTAVEAVVADAATATEPEPPAEWEMTVEV